MTTHVESAWPSYPDYRVDISPCRFTSQVWAGDQLVAESDACLVVAETDHVDRLYFPESSVRWNLFTPSATTTVCPFKGVATYWSLSQGDSPAEDVVWTYRTPLAEVAALAGHVSFYDGALRTVVVETWPDATKVATIFPLWGDAAELVRLIDVTPATGTTFTGAAHGPTQRDVVEGGQLAAAGLVAVSKSLPSQRVTSISMTFTKAASFTAPVEIDVGILRRGRTFSTADVRISQHGVLRSAGLALADTGADDVIRDVAPLPDAPGPDDAVPFLGFGMTGREIRVGPPVINAWVRFRDSPRERYLHQALLAQSSTHWTIAAGMLPHRGFGEADAHRTLSTGIIKATIAFHDDVDVSEWLLYSNCSFWSGRGLVQGEGRVHTRDGRLAASYSVQAMVRRFERSPEDMGHDSRTAM